MGCTFDKDVDIIDEEKDRYCLNEDVIDTKEVFKCKPLFQSILNEKIRYNDVALNDDEFNIIFGSIIVAEEHNEHQIQKIDTDNIENIIHSKMVIEEETKIHIEYDDANKNYKDDTTKQSLWRANTELMSEILISGYCRDNNNKYRFPDVLMDIIYEYTHHCDRWNIEYNKKDVMITNNGSVATLMNHGQHTIYGDHIIKYGDIYQWTMKIKSINGREKTTECILIGLIKNDTKIMNKYELIGYWGSNRRKGYDGYLFDGSLAMISPPKMGKYYGNIFDKEGDIITMRVNKHSVSYIINGIDYGVAFNDIDKCEYRLAVCFVYAGSQLELL